MIAFLRGELLSSDTDSIVIDVAGVGYKVHVSSATRSALGAQGSEARLYIHTHVREDAITLYGFLSSEEEKLFELLLGVSGIGPKVALSVLASMPPVKLRLAVASNDLAALSKVPGVGKKTAQRMTLELKDKIGPSGAERDEDYSETAFGGTIGIYGDEAVQALVALGFSQNEAGRAISRAKSELGDDARVEELIKTALRFSGIK